MKVYIREVEEDGAICDPVKAVTTVQVHWFEFVTMIVHFCFIYHLWFVSLS